MRKILKMCTILIVSLLYEHCYASLDGISISHSTNTISVNFNLPSFTIKNMDIDNGEGSYITYQYIDVDSDDYLDVSEEGYPIVPYINIYLQVPNNTDKVSKVVIKNKKSSTKQIANKLAPALKEGLEYESEQFVQYNYYHDTQSTIHYQVSNTFMVMGQKGICLTVYPFYTFSIDTECCGYDEYIGYITNATFTITYSTSNSADYSQDQPVSNSATEEYLNAFFANRVGSTYDSKLNGKYLMITAPEFEATIQQFAEYKISIGYDVNVVSTSKIGETATEIKNYIKQQYNNLTTRPNFVLLVGDVDKIPASGGRPGDSNDPLTDLNYVRLNGDDYFADAHIGRFPIANNDELKNIIGKTIYMETQLSNMNKQALLLSGSPLSSDKSDVKQAEKFVECIRDIDKKGVKGYAKTRLEYTSGKRGSDLKNEMERTPYHMLLYRGHGSVVSISDFNLYSQKNPGIKDTWLAKSYPILFSICCKTGNYGDIVVTNESDYYLTNACIGEAWIRSPKGGCAFWGASTSSGTKSNQKIAKIMFGENSSYVDNDRLGAIINVTMSKLYRQTSIYPKANDINNRVYQLKRYNLLGDPSFFVRGIAGNENLFVTFVKVIDGNKATFNAKSKVQVKETKVSDQSSLKVSSEKSIILGKGFCVEKGSSFTATIKK